MLFRDNRILFFDQANIESSENVNLVMNPPVKAGSCLNIETEWELAGAHASCVIQWEGKWWFISRNGAVSIPCKIDAARISIG